MSRAVVRGRICQYKGCKRKQAQISGSRLCLVHYNLNKDECPVCVCDDPTPDVIGECQQCRRPYRQETFAECRAAWREHLGLSSSSDAVSAGRDGFTQPVLDDSARPGSRPPLASGRATSGELS